LAVGDDSQHTKQCFKCKQGQRIHGLAYCSFESVGEQVFSLDAR